MGNTVEAHYWKEYAKAATKIWRESKEREALTRLAQAG
jgi:hypothetical protein